jgi:RHS repeat-associated protein
MVWSAVFLRRVPRAVLRAGCLCLALAAGDGLAVSGNPETPVTGERKQEKTDDITDGDPVSPVTGGMLFGQTDVAVRCPGVSLDFARNYLSTRPAETNAPCGPGWRHSWEWRLAAGVTISSYRIIGSSVHFALDNVGRLFLELGRPDGMVAGDAVTVGRVTVKLVSITSVQVTVSGSTGNGGGTASVEIWHCPCYTFEVERPAETGKVRLAAPDGQECRFSGEKRLGGLVLADDGNYRITPYSLLGLSADMYVAPPAQDLSKIEQLLSQMDLFAIRAEERAASGVVWDGGGTAYSFSAGALTRVQAAAGESVAVERDAGGRITRLAHSNGLALTLSYEGQRLVRLGTPEPEFFTTYAYDAAGCLTGAVRHTSSGARGDAYAYAAGGHCMTNRVNAAGREYRYAYGPFARDGRQVEVCTFAELSGGYYRTGLEYGTNANWSAVTEWLSDGRSRRRRFEWDDARRINLIATEPSVPGKPGALSEFTRTAAGGYGSERHASESGDYLSVRRQYDGRYNVTNECAAVNRDPAPSEGVSAEWHELYAMPLKVWDADGVAASFAYDEFGRMTRSVTWPSPEAPAVTEAAWNGSLPVSVTDPCGRVTTFSYDALGRISGVFPQAGPPAQFENDVLGHTRRIVEPSPDPESQRVTLIESDEAGRDRTVTYPDGLSDSLRHDACGNPTSSVSRAGRRADAAWLPAAHLGSVTRWLDASTPATVTYKYDYLFNSLAVTDPMGREVERYSLDDEDRVTTVTNLEGRVFTAVYGAGGQVLSMTRYDGVTVSNAWDSLGNLLGVAHKPAGTAAWLPVSGYSWSTAGRMLSASNATARAAWTYDGEGGATAEAQSVVGGPASRVAWTYDESGLETNSSVSVGSASPPVISSSVAYDSASRISAQATPAGEFSYSYCAWDGLVSSVSNAVLVETRAFDLLDRVTNIAYSTSGGAPVRCFSYFYDPDGLITRKVEVVAGGESSTHAYAYDGLGRLVSADGVSYAYDLAGNRVSQNGEGGQPVLSTFTHNRLDGYLYDAAGNTTNMVRAGVALSLAWDTQGRLVSVATNGAFAESYTYDALGRRASTTDGGGTVYHVYDGDECAADVDASGNLLRSYTLGDGIDNLLAVTVFSSDATNTYYAVKDHLGSVHALIDSSGQPAAQFTYDAWGNVLSTTITSSVLTINSFRYLWQGREYSFATGLYNFRARWYDSVTGRWLSKDPIGLEGGLNLYAFCGNDPVNFIDPSGLFWQEAGNVLGDVAGKAWNMPNTVIGLGWGIIGGGLIPGYGTEICFDNNAIEFRNHPFMFGAITIGNTISYSRKCGPSRPIKGGKGAKVRDHERQHTYQGEILGPTYLPLHLINGMAGLVNNGNWHGPANALEKGPQSIPPRP